MAKVNLSANGGVVSGSKRCNTCRRRPRRGSSKQCGRCSRFIRTDITSFLARRSSLIYCDGCSSYFQPPRKWVRADPNSTKLLSLCIRRLSKPLPRSLRILNSQFIGSDNNNIKVKLHLRGEISLGAISERHHFTEFTVRHKICKSCRRSDPQRWVTRVELRQSHLLRRSTLSYLEKAISNHGAARRALRIQEHDLGTDFMFSSRSHALDLVRFVEGLLPVEKRSDDDGVSTTFFSLHILPICRDDLIRLPTAILDSSSLGGSSLVICTEVAAHGISLMDPFTLQAAFLTAGDYWRAPFRAMLYSNLLVEYLVLDIVVISPDPPLSNEADDDDNSYRLAHAHIARVSDLGKKDGHNKLMVRTHLGRLLKTGDYVLGYDVGGASAGGPASEVILVKKSYQARRRSRGEPNAQELGSMDMGLDGVRNDEYEELLRDLEENARLGLINASPHQISKKCQVLPTSSGDVPSIPEGKCLGDEAAADNNTMEWLPSPQQEVFDTCELVRTGYNMVLHNTTPLQAITLLI